MQTMFIYNVICHATSALRTSSVIAKSDNGLRKQHSYVLLKMGLSLPPEVLSYCVRWRRATRVRGEGRACVHPPAPPPHRIISLPRRATNDARLRERSLRYAADLRRAVTRHVWRDRCLYVCVWCSVDTDNCVVL